MFCSHLLLHTYTFWSIIIPFFLNLPLCLLLLSALYSYFFFIISFRFSLLFSLISCFSSFHIFPRFPFRCSYTFNSFPFYFSCLLTPFFITFSTLLTLIFLFPFSFPISSLSFLPNYFTYHHSGKLNSLILIHCVVFIHSTLFGPLEAEKDV